MTQAGGYVGAHVGEHVGTGAMRTHLVGAGRDASLTGLISLGLFLPLLGFQTITDIRNVLILTTRCPLLLAVGAGITASRFFYLMTVAPRLERGALRLPQP